MADANKKENIFARIGRWFREMRSELKKVVWPSKNQIIKNTLTVIACTVVVAIIIGVLDKVAGEAYHGLLRLARDLR